MTNSLSRSGKLLKKGEKDSQSSSLRCLEELKNFHVSGGRSPRFFLNYSKDSTILRLKTGSFGGLRGSRWRLSTKTPLGKKGRGTRMHLILHSFWTTSKHEICREQRGLISSDPYSFDSVSLSTCDEEMREGGGGASENHK